MGRKLKIHPPERLKEQHKLEQFDCGVHAMNHWLKKIARRANNDTAAVFIVRTGRRVVAYFATAMGSVPLVSAGKLGNNAPPDIPVFVLARLAVDKEYQGRGIGQNMVADALKRAMLASRQAGMRTVIVHTLTDDLKKFYSTLGFKLLEPDGKTMFIQLEEIRSAL